MTAATSGLRTGEPRDERAAKPVREWVLALFVWTVADAMGLDVGPTPPRTLDEVNRRIEAAWAAEGKG